ncbi:MAG: hypothetical protein MI723_05925, partial [Caulobacterales bacterium]|nr:hypothetical protein [Caulobacterales bacterium]
TNTRLVTEEFPDRFGLLPLGEASASDSLLFARTDFLEKNKDDIAILVEELKKVAAEFKTDPSLPAKLREKYELLQDLPQEMVDEITPYFEVAAAACLFPTDGGNLAAVKSDLSFLAQSGALKGDPDELDPKAFWTFEFIGAQQ